MKKTALYVSLMVCVAFAGTAMAAPVVYNITSDGAVFGGTITFDTDIAPDWIDGTLDVYDYGTGTGAINSFSLWTTAAPGLFYTSADSVSAFQLKMESDDTPVILQDIDIDITGSSMFGFDVEFGVGTGNGAGVLEAPASVTITGAEMTAIPEPATMSLLVLGGLALIRRRKRA